MTGDPPRRGELRWAAVPYALEAPFRVDGADAPLGLPAVLGRLRGAGGPLDVAVPVKVRPVLVVHSWVGSAHGAYAVLRASRIARLDPVQAARVRAGRDPHVIPLAGRYAGHERAVVLGAIDRVHASAFDPEPLGAASPDEMRRIGEGLAALLELDLDRLVERRARDLVGGLA